MNNNHPTDLILTSEMFGTIPVQAGLTILDLEQRFNEPSAKIPRGPDRPSPGWIWDGILLRGQISLLVGDWKIGKTAFLTELIRHVSSGTPCLGRGVNSTTIGIVSEETHGHWDRRHREKPLPSSLRIMSHEAPDKVHAFSLPKCVRRVSVARPGLIIVDSIGRLLSPAAERHAKVMARCLDQVLQAANGAAVLFVHHPCRSRSRGGGAGGSKLLPGAAHAILELLPYSTDPADTNRRLLRIRSRLPPSPTTLAYEWHPDDQRITAIDPPSNAIERREITMIQTLLAERPDGCGTVSDLLSNWPLDADPISRTTLLRRLRIATDRHELTRKGRGVNADPFVYSLGPSSSRTVIAKDGDGPVSTLL